MTLNSERTAWIIGAAGLIGSGIGSFMAPAEFPHAWLAAVTCFLGWPLGSLALLLIHALTGGRWGLAIRPQLASGIATLPLLLPALLPVLVMGHSLYPWMQPVEAAQLNNRFYLNAPFFYGRSLIYLLVWLGLGFAVLHALRRANPQPLLYRMAPPALMLLALTMTFAAIDYTLSMEPQFKSSIFGMLVGSESLLLALSVALLGMTFAPKIPGERPRDLGRLLLALVVLWAYLDFMQVLIVWNSDLPEEAGWYLHRLAGSWATLAVLIAGLHFGLPFFTLLWPRIQRSRAAIGWVAALLVGIEVPRAWWTVIPAAGRSLAWVDVAAMMAVLGLAAGIALRAFHGRLPRAAERPGG